MPTYVYKFLDTGETLEVQQSFSDPTLTEAVHPVTGATLPVKKVFQPVGVTFKGDGFYKTDSRNGSKRSTSGSPESTSSPGPDSTAAAGAPATSATGASTAAGAATPTASSTASGD